MSISRPHTFAIAATIAVLQPLPGQAQSRVEIYGVLDVGLHTGVSDGVRSTRLDSSPVAPSRFGFQSMEDLGGGLKALVRIEGGINADTGASTAGTLFGREAYVGLQGGAGTVQLGLNYTPMFFAYVSYAQGDLNTFSWGNATNNFVFLPTIKQGNSLRYTSPALANFTLRAIHALGNEGAAGQPANLGKTSGVGLQYRAGPLAADLDYLRQNYAASATLTPTTAVGTGNYALFGMSYDFGILKPALLYQRHRGSADVLTAIGASFANPDNDYYELNTLIRSSPLGTILLSFGQYRKQADSSGNARSYAARYDYRLSKRTGLYVGAGHIQNNSNASFTMSNGAGPGIVTATGKNLNSMVMGLVTRF
ncbi:porin [Oxalobacteraceae bacterium]|nr:porin [Oxalobacteraceae bacterium]